METAESLLDFFSGHAIMKTIRLRLTRATTFIPTLSAAALVTCLLSAGASAQTLPNGTFSITGSSALSSADSYIDAGGKITNSSALPGWTATGTGYACVASGSSITTSGSYCGTSGGQPALVFTTSPGSVVAGYTGNVFVDDAGGAYADTISTTIAVTASTAAQTYALSFYYAGAQQSGFTGQTQDWWSVGLNGATPNQVTPSITIGNNGTTNPTNRFVKDTIDFTVAAGATSETISFLAAGNGSAGVNQPPFMMLADLSVVKVPEPASITILGAGVLGLIASRRRARARA